MVSKLPVVDDTIIGMERYKIYRPFLEDGDVLEWRSNTIIGAGIRAITHKDVNHTGGVLRMGGYENLPGDRVVTPEALEHGFVLSALSARLSKFGGKVYLLKLKSKYEGYRKYISSHQLSIVGTPYDYPSIAAQIFGKVSLDVKLFFCSEGIEYSLEKAGTIPIQEKALRPGEFEKLGVFEPRVRIF